MNAVLLTEVFMRHCFALTLNLHEAVVVIENGEVTGFPLLLTRRFQNNFFFHFLKNLLVYLRVYNFFVTLCADKTETRCKDIIFSIIIKEKNNFFDYKNEN